jgi:hypothetical protein
MQNASDGTTLLVWNTPYDPPGQLLLQAALELTNMSSYSASSSPVTTVFGPVITFQTANALQFDPLYSVYDSSSGATLYAVTTPGASYTIAVTDPNGNPLNQFSGNADSSGVIYVPWNLTESGGQTYSGSSFNANFTVGSQTAASETLSQVGSLNYPDGDFTVAYATDVSSMQGYQPYQFTFDTMIQYGVVNPLMLNTVDNPNPNAYTSDLNKAALPNAPAQGYAGYIAGTSDISGFDHSKYASALITSLQDPATCNFYAFMHGSPSWIGDAVSGKGEVTFYADSVGQALGNCTQWVHLPIFPVGISAPFPCVAHPYRFVFLDCCDTAGGTDWPKAFGIPARQISSISDPKMARAFLGWTGDVFSFNGLIANEYLYTLSTFFGSCWQPGGGNTLQYCVDFCTDPMGLWTYFIQTGIITQQQWYSGGYVFPDGSAKDVWPIGRSIYYSPSASFQKYPDGSLTKIYGYQYITRTGYQ